MSGGLAKNPSMFFFFFANRQMGFAGKEETNGWKIKNVTGRFLVVRYTPHILSVDLPFSGF